MAIQLKTYQIKTLDTLKTYLEAARFQGAQKSYDTIEKPGVINIRPYKPLEGLEAVPFVCLRLPTGGGKTLLSAHSIRVASETYLEREFPVVIWLVPSNTIRQQTLETLKTPGNANYESLHAAFGGSFTVLDISDFTQIKPHDLVSKACVVVASMQIFRVNDTDKRKVYAHHEDLEPHFTKISDNAAGMERDENGKIKMSFRNLLHSQRPMVVVDESHNFSTPLSRQVLQDINAACVIEFTATPDKSNSNILHQVSATELKAEEMIKLPIRLKEHVTWEEAVRDSILTRKRLEDLAKTEKEYVRPIVLFQAENKGQDITWQVLKDHLTNNEDISADEIAVVTGDERELDGVNLFDKDCPIDYVITVQALKEGWDCSFAYVFCSVANINSAKDVEQILGRVLRMPYAKRRSNDDLNRAYAHVSKTSWPHAIKQLHDRLVDMGFEKEEADTSLEYVAPGLDLNAPQAKLAPPVPVVLVLQVATELSETDKKAVEIEKTDEGFVAKVTGLVSAEGQKKLLSSLKPEAKEVAVVELMTQQAALQRFSAPANNGELFVIPQLCLNLDGDLVLPEGDIFLDAGQWALTGPVRLTPDEFNLQEDGKTFEIDIRDGHLQERFVGTTEQMNLDLVDTGWTDLALSRWLDRRLRQPDITQPVLLEFIRRTVVYLVEERGIPMPALVRGRFLLQKKLEEKIKHLRNAARKKGYQASLFAANAPVEVSFENGLNLGPYDYAPRSLYVGRPYVFTRHYYPQVGELKNTGEEFECAKILDMHPKVKFWLRNIERTECSFRLPTSTDYFYPDFVAMLTDGRILVIEYKGDMHVPEDVAEKESIGKLWENKSDGKGLFLMAWKDKVGRSTTQQIYDVIG